MRAGNLRYVHSANEPDLIAGVGTYALEIFEALADVDTVLVPIGGGSGACGLITVRDALGLKTRIIGVGAESADAVARSWRTGTRVVGESADTLAEGVATRVTFDLTFGILQRGLDDFVSLSRRAQLAERRPAGARSDAQPGRRRRRRRIARRGRAACRLAARSARGRA